MWDVRFPAFGEHPAVVFSVNPLDARLGHVAAVPITGTRGPELTHVPLSARAGLTRYDESYADVTGAAARCVRTVPDATGLLARREIERIGDLIRIYLGLWHRVGQPDSPPL